MQDGEVISFLIPCNVQGNDPVKCLTQNTFNILNAETLVASPIESTSCCLNASKQMAPFTA